MYHDENINFLYHEYKNCLRNNFENQFNRNNVNVEFGSQCKHELENIDNYQNAQYERVANIVCNRQTSLYNRLDESYLKFNVFGWTEKQVRNL